MKYEKEWEKREQERKQREYEENNPVPNGGWETIFNYRINQIKGLSCPTQNMMEQIFFIIIKKSY